MFCCDVKLGIIKHQGLIIFTYCFIVSYVTCICSALFHIRQRSAAALNHCLNTLPSEGRLKIK